MWTEQENSIEVGKCHNTLGIASTLLGDTRKAVEEFDAAATIFDEVGEPFNEAMVRNNLGPLLTQMGDWAGAEENLREAIRLCLRMDAAARLLHPLENMARLYQSKGDAESARRRWQELLGQSRSMGYWDTEIVARCGLGTLHLEAGDLESARAELAAARQLVPKDENWPDYREDLELFAGRLAAAEADEATALEIFEGAEEELLARNRYLWATYRLYHGEIRSQKEPAEAREIVKEALDVFTQLAAEPMRQRAEALLARIGGE
jgi:tetratricopeptide (TPR) repeat protein